MSRQAMKAMLENEIPSKTAIISFYDPPSKKTPQGYGPIDYSGRCDRVFMVPIPDIDIDLLDGFGYTFETYISNADKLAEFIIKAYNDGYDFICQCDYGQSRSAACAAAILEYFEKSGITIFADYRYYPNQVVFNRVFKALKDCCNNDLY